VPHFTGDSRDPAPRRPEWLPPCYLVRRPTCSLSVKPATSVAIPTPRDPAGPTCRPLCPPAQATSCARRSNVRCPFACHSRSCSPRGSTRGGYEAPAAARERKPRKAIDQRGQAGRPDVRPIQSPERDATRTCAVEPRVRVARLRRVLSYPSPQDFGTAANSTNEPSAPGPSSHCSHRLSPREY